GVNAYFEDCNLTSGVVGPGGAGGAGGTGGGGGAAGAGNPYTGGEVGAGGNGGAGGTGGSGGSGGIGSAGETIGLYINGGTAPTLMDTSFNLAVQPTITMDDVNCTYTDIDYMTAVSNTWGFGVGSIPQNLTGDTVTTQYDTISRKDILYGSEIYTGFANILFDGAPVSITVVSAGGAINLCAGDSILLTATSGYTNYQWMQNDTDIVGATDSLLWVNDSGAYTVKVLTTCCGIGIAKDTIDVDVYPLPIADAGLDTTICNGFSVTLSGSGADFYSWSPAATLDSSTLQNPTATPPDTTTYVLIVSDTIGCNDVDTVTVNVNPNPIVVVDTFDVSCNGQNDGSAMANPSGSTSPYLYQWDDNNNQINQTATGLPPGVYHVTVTDSNTCATVDSVLITEPTLLTATEDSTNATCYGGCDGTAVYTLSGGTPAYSYAWSDGQSGSVAIGLCAGTYIVTAQDSNSCLSIGIFEITQPPQMTSTTDSTDALCGLPTGSATVTITSGGQSPFNYQWDNNAFNQITQIATGLLGGTYSVTVTDQMGCFIVETITVIDPPAVNATMDAIAETCGESNGVAIISAMNGGTPPFTYQWDASAGNQTGTIATGLAGGTYEVIITDNLGCADTTTVTVPSVGFLDADFDADPIQGLEPLEVEFEDESTGTIDSYSWDFQGDTDSSQSPTYIFQNDGEYNVVLTIANSYGCVDTASMLIIVDALSDLELPNVFSPNGDGINDVFIVKALAMQEVEVTIMSRWGQLMAYWNDLATGFWDGRTPSGLEAPEGTYFVVVKATGNDYDKPYLETKTLTLVR
ncbi:gliding motility-associated C-terminal domain-containing protein, partial [Bacteroidales bacterium AH-315-I05]|nr:gliding motility-associated C-terminal domain-containing protein [Bacteroidales bacterium AH-315-I05]